MMDAPTLDAALTEHHVASELRSRIAQSLEGSGAMSWPLSEQALARHVSSIIVRGCNVSAWDDVALAFACTQRIDAAWEGLSKKVSGTLTAALSRILPAAQADDLKQSLFTELAGANSALLTYSGEGPLAGWLVVVATRRAWKLAKADQRLSDDDSLFDRVMEGPSNPASELFRSQHRETFRTCIKTAFQRLSPKDRNLLRLHHLDGVQTAELASMHGVHRATVVRWLADSRQSFVSNFRDEFAAKLGVPRMDADSLANDFRSSLDISLPLESVDVGIR